VNSFFFQFLITIFYFESFYVIDFYIKKNHPSIFALIFDLLRINLRSFFIFGDFDQIVCGQGLTSIFLLIFFIS
jgi:hypothetical protein